MDVTWVVGAQGFYTVFVIVTYKTIIFLTQDHVCPVKKTISIAHGDFFWEAAKGIERVKVVEYHRMFLLRSPNLSPLFKISINIKYISSQKMKIKSSLMFCLMINLNKVPLVCDVNQLSQYQYWFVL